PAGTLICPAARNRANQEFQVEVVRDELTDELVEQFRMAGWVVLATEAVHGVDQADAEEVMPEAIDGGPGEPGIVAAGDPLGERLTRRDGPGPVRFAPVREAGLYPGVRTADLDAGWPRSLRARCRDKDRVAQFLAQ